MHVDLPIVWWPSVPEQALESTPGVDPGFYEGGSSCIKARENFTAMPIFQ